MLEFALGLFTLYRVLKSFSETVKSKPREIRSLQKYGNVLHGDYQLWSLSNFDSNGSYEPGKRESLGVVISKSPPTAAFNGVYELRDLKPPARFFVLRDNNTIWTEEVVSSDLFLAYLVHDNLIILGENIMSYATGKSDFKDTKQYVDQNWSADPILLQPVKVSSAGLAPAYASDEVIVGVVHSFESRQVPLLDEQGQEQVDAQGNTITTTLYDISVLIAEADVDCPNQASEDIGKPLYVQSAYVQSTATFSDIYSVVPPASGYTHPLFIVTDQDSAHYNGTVRPEKI